jgi:ketosteroid isomerase-like protein
MPSSLTESELLKAYVSRHNFGVTNNDFSGMLELFSDDAILIFQGTVQMTLKGKEAIARAFTTMRPTSQIYALEIIKQSHGAEAAYSFADNSDQKAGIIGVTSQRGFITSMTITID